jgi:hypothetical protein
MAMEDPGAAAMIDVSTSVVEVGGVAEGIDVVVDGVDVGTMVIPIVGAFGFSIG